VVKTKAIAPAPKHWRKTPHGTAAHWAFSLKSEKLNRSEQLIFVVRRIMHPQAELVGEVAVRACDLEIVDGLAGLFEPVRHHLQRRGTVDIGDDVAGHQVAGQDPADFLAIARRHIDRVLLISLNYHHNNKSSNEFNAIDHIVGANVNEHVANTIRCHKFLCENLNIFWLGPE